MYEAKPQAKIRLQSRALAKQLACMNVATHLASVGKSQVRHVKNIVYRYSA